MSTITPETLSIDNPALAAEAAEIGALAAASDETYGDAAEKAIEAGARLIKVKLDLGPGQFQKFVKAHSEALGFGLSRAKELIQIAQGTKTHAELTEATRQRVAKHREKIKELIDSARAAERDANLKTAKRKVEKAEQQVAADAEALAEATDPNSNVVEMKPKAEEPKVTSSKIALQDFRDTVDEFLPQMTAPVRRSKFCAIVLLVVIAMVAPWVAPLATKATFRTAFECFSA
jgi:DNA-binding transcriptional MerR regulator